MSLFDFIEDEEVRNKAQVSHDTAMTELNEGIDTKITEAVSGLKQKNEELLDEKKKIQQALQNFDGIKDVEAAKEALKFLEENEDAQLIKDGRIDELLQKKTSQMRSDHEAMTKDLASKLDESEKSNNIYKSKYENKVIDDELRAVALKAKVRPEAVSDILLRGRSVFSLAEDQTLESRDGKGNLTKTDDDKVMTPSLWIDSLKSASPHYWPTSEGAGAGGGTGDLSDLEAQMHQASREGNVPKFRELRKKLQSKKNA